MSQHEPEATPAQQEAVRRLLAEARHTEPLPDDVADRLDGVLARLAAEGTGAVDAPEPTQAVVVDLAARRRRRVTGLLGAAAAVVVLGVGVSQVVDRTGSDGDDDSAQTDSRANAAGEADQPEAGDGAAPAAPQTTASEDTPLPDDVMRVGSPDFKQTVLRLRNSAAVTSSDDGTAYSAEDLTSDPMFVCPATVLGAGRLVAVTYVGSPAVLAYRAPTGDTQTVELLQCGTGEVLRSVVVPAR